MNGGEYILAEKAYETLVRRKWTLKKVKRNDHAQGVESFTLWLESRRLLSKAEARINIWRGKLNIMCCKSQYIAEISRTALSSLGGQGGVLRIADVLLAGGTTTELEFKFVCADPDIDDLFHEAANFFDTFGFPTWP